MVIVITHTIMQKRHRALMWKVVSNQSQKTNAVASAKPMLVATQNHFLKVAPASMAAAIVITMENPMHHGAAVKKGVDVADRGMPRIHENLKALKNKGCR